MKNHNERKEVCQSLRMLVLAVTPLILVGCGQKPDPTSVAPPAKQPANGDQVVAQEPIVDSASSTASIASADDKKVVDVPTFLDAALNGELETVRQAIAAGLDVDSSDDQGRTALLFACFNGHTTVAKLLLEKGAELKHRDALGRTALMFAATGANPEVVEFLLDSGAEVNAADTDEGFTALMHAAAEGQVKVVQVLLKYKADPELRDVDGDTARDFASRNGHTEVVQLLTK